MAGFIRRRRSVFRRPPEPVTWFVGSTGNLMMTSSGRHVLNRDWWPTGARAAVYGTAEYIRGCRKYRWVAWAGHPLSATWFIQVYWSGPVNVGDHNAAPARLTGDV